MGKCSPKTGALGRDSAAFATTHWSVVRHAQGKSSAEARQALASLCETYWYPLYAFIRRRGHAEEDAKDLTQGFFADLLKRGFPGSVDPCKGRFRSFLLASVKYFLANEWDRNQCGKRGGGCVFVSFDEAAEERYCRELAEAITAETLFDRSWAMGLLQAAFEQLAREYAAAGHARLFEALEPCLSGEREAPAYGEVAARLGMTEAAIKMAMVRLRRRYGQLLRAQVAQSVNGSAEVEDELRCLFAAVGR